MALVIRTSLLSALDALLLHELGSYHVWSVVLSLVYQLSWWAWVARVYLILQQNVLRCVPLTTPRLASPWLQISITWDDRHLVSTLRLGAVHISTAIRLCHDLHHVVVLRRNGVWRKNVSHLRTLAVFSGLRMLKHHFLSLTLRRDSTVTGQYLASPIGASFDLLIVATGLFQVVNIAFKIAVILLIPIILTYIYCRPCWRVALVVFLTVRGGLFHNELEYYLLNWIQR